jgi:ABC-2 type transport system permease protein
MKSAFEEFRNCFEDRRLLVLLLVVSPLVLLLFGYAARNDLDGVDTVVVGPGAKTMREALPSFFNVVSSNTHADRPEAISALSKAEADVAVIADRQPQLLIDGVSLFKARAVLGIAQRVPQLGLPEVLFNPELNLTVSLLPAVSGLVLLVTSSLIISMSLARDREAGRFEQFAGLGRKLAELVIGRLFYWGVILTLVAVLVVLLNRVLFDMPYRADLATTAVAGGVFAFAALGIGVFVAAIAKSRGKAIALSVGLLVPQILLSGAIFPTEAIAPGLRWLPYLLPMSYVVNISQGIALRGQSLGEPNFPLTFAADDHSLVVAYDGTISSLDLSLFALATAGLVGLTVGCLLLHKQLRAHEGTTVRRSAEPVTYGSAETAPEA